MKPEQKPQTGETTKDTTTKGKRIVIPAEDPAAVMARDLAGLDEELELKHYGRRPQDPLDYLGEPD